MCHLYQSVNKAKGKSENLGKRCWDQRFVGREKLQIPEKRLLIKSEAEQEPLPSNEGKNETVQS